MASLDELKFSASRSDDEADLRSTPQRGCLPGQTVPMSQSWMSTPSGLLRGRALGVPLAGRPGEHNSITDVPGVEVGTTTLIEGDNVRTGVTAIHPRRHDPGDPCAAGVHVLNGNGEMTGVSWIAESGTMTGPICITNTHAVGIAHAGIVEWVTDRHPELGESWLLPVVAETWDGRLNEINRQHVTVEHVMAALDAAHAGPIEEGSVGGGTGMVCYGYKGGNGTASRLVEHAGTTYTVGAFLQANFGRRRTLTIAGHLIGPRLDAEPDDDTPTIGPTAVPAAGPVQGAGSVIVVIATDAPLLPDQCRALARRVTIGLARTGTFGGHTSGDIFLALSTGNRRGFSPAADALTGASRPLDRIDFVPWAAIDPFFEAVVEATEEAVLNAMIANRDMTGYRGSVVPALPHDVVRALFTT
jgi:D-aminopeptidase